MPGATRGTVTITPGLRPTVEALFLGPKSENREIFTSLLNFLVEEHLHWRRDFHPRDAAVVSPGEMRAEGFLATTDRMRSVLLELSARLKDTSTPWFSTRYLGHMNSDTLMVSNLAYMASILYNPNNVAYESSIATSKMEIECGADFAGLMGYDPAISWGHVTSDGTIANYEGLWLARNLKSFPLAVKVASPRLVRGRDDWELLNLPPAKVLDLLDATKKNRSFARSLRASVRGTGTGTGRGTLGKVLVPSSRHYSWEKAVDILGLGVDQLVSIPVDRRFRMDVDRLRAELDDCLHKEIPVIAVVGVVGSTEEGAVDDIGAIVRLRQEFQRRGLSFYLHVDAAYGGYGRSLFLDARGKFLDYAELQRRLTSEGLANWGPGIPSQEVWASFKAISSADSVTIDPHKMGYVPYAAGGIAIRDKRVLGLVSYAAAYVFEAKTALDVNLGSVILEGSKAGSSVAAVWAAHRLLPLNLGGYGQIVSRSIEGAYHFEKTLETVREFDVGRRKVVCQPLLAHPDFNIVCMAFNLKGNRSLEKMNRLNEAIYHASSFESGPLYGDEWITSHTELSREIYGEAPRDFLDRLGIGRREWEKVGTVYVLRSCVMHPWIAKHSTYPVVWESYIEIMKKQIAQILSS
jgi:tyrosine decarboxylase